jgi:hypothetical protein
MEAIFDGQDYVVVVDKNSGELQTLASEPLSALLNDRSVIPSKAGALRQLVLDFGLPTEKTLLLMLDDEVRQDSDGIRVEYLPENSEEWSSVDTVRVRIAQRALRLLQAQGEVGTRYGMGDKILITTRPMF